MSSVRRVHSPWKEGGLVTDHVSSTGRLNATYLDSLGRSVVRSYLSVDVGGDPNGHCNTHYWRKTGYRNTTKQNKTDRRPLLSFPESKVLKSQRKKISRRTQNLKECLKSCGTNLYYYPTLSSVRPVGRPCPAPYLVTGISHLYAYVGPGGSPRLPICTNVP